MPSYDAAGSDWGGPQPGTITLRNEIKRLFPEVQVTYPFGIYASRPPSEHAEGRALDAGLDATNAVDKAVGDLLFAWAINNWEPWGIQSVIWNRRCWGFGAWYERNYSGRSPHTDHVHIGQTKWAARNLGTTPGLKPDDERWDEMATMAQIEAACEKACVKALNEFRFTYGQVGQVGYIPAPGIDLTDLFGEVRENTMVGRNDLIAIRQKLGA